MASSKCLDEELSDTYDADLWAAYLVECWRWALLNGEIEVAQPGCETRQVAVEEVTDGTSD